MKINFQVDPIDPGTLSHIFINADETGYNINELIIPDTIDGNKILRLSPALKYDLYELAAKGFFIKKLIISEGIKELPIKCFYGVGNINTVILPSTCIDIPPSCFELSSIKEVIASDNVCVIGASAFEQSNIERFSWPASCDTVPTKCFFGSDLSEISFKGNVAVIESCAFAYLNHLKSFSWPEKCRTIPANCFTFDRNLLKIVFSSYIEEINLSAFISCDRLDKIDLSKSWFVTVLNDSSVFESYSILPETKEKITAKITAKFIQPYYGFNFFN